MAENKPERRRRSKAAFIMTWLAFIVMVAGGVAVYLGVTGVMGSDASTVVQGFNPERDMIAVSDVTVDADFTSVDLDPGVYSVMMVGKGFVFEDQNEIGELLDDPTGLTTRLIAAPVLPLGLEVQKQGGEEVALREPSFENASMAANLDSAAFADFTVREKGTYEFRAQNSPNIITQLGIAEAKDYTIVGATSWFGDLMRNGGLVVGGGTVVVVAIVIWLICFFVWLFSGRKPQAQAAAQPQIIYVQAPPPGAPAQAVQYADGPPHQAMPPQVVPPQAVPPSPPQAAPESPRSPEGHI